MTNGKPFEMEGQGGWPNLKPPKHPPLLCTTNRKARK